MWAQGAATAPRQPRRRGRTCYQHNIKNTTQQRGSDARGRFSCDTRSVVMAPRPRGLAADSSAAVFAGDSVVDREDATKVGVVSKVADQSDSEDDYSDEDMAPEVRTGEHSGMILTTYASTSRLV